MTTADEKFQKAYTVDDDGVKRFATASDHANWLVARIGERTSTEAKDGAK